MGTWLRSELCARALLLAAIAVTGCGEGTATGSPTLPQESTDPLPNTDPEHNHEHPSDMPQGDPMAPEPLPGPDHTQGTDVPVTSRAFLNFPERASDAAQSPALLSETGAFTNLATLETAAGLLPYGVQNPLWSDGAHKQRWLSLPADGRIGFAATGQWSFPEGTVFVKHFAMALDGSRPDEVRHLETRFWIAARGGEFYGVVYKWDEDQREARLLLDGATEELSIMGSDGTTRTQTYSYPSTPNCRTCHSQAAGLVRGVNTLQLNGEYDYGAARGSPPGGTAASNDLGAGMGLGGPPVLANQLATLDAFGLFEQPIGDPSQYGHLSPLGDEAAPLVDRVRSYWDSNCSMCHYGAGSPSWDARYQTPLAEQMLLMAPPIVGPGPDDLRLILPQEPDRSYLYLRGNSTTPGVRMPPMLRNRVDETYVALLRDWILSLERQ
jgi:hypothetical protein